MKKNSLLILIISLLLVSCGYKTAPKYTGDRMKGVKQNSLGQDNAY